MKLEDTDKAIELIVEVYAIAKLFVERIEKIRQEDPAVWKEIQEGNIAATQRLKDAGN